MKGARVYIATDAVDRVQDVINDLKEETGRESIFFLNLDLGNLDSIQAAAEEFIRRETELHTLYNNA
jgi:retinol dehydrogenase 12